MSKITLNSVGSLIDVTSAQATINNNSNTIQTAFDNTLSRDGTAPNAMAAPLDMSSNAIINLPAPIALNSPLRLVDANTLNGGGTIAGLPAGGTTGQPLVKTSNTDYLVNWDTITGTGSTVKQTSPTLVTPNIGTPSAGTLTNTTGFPAANLAGAGAGITTFLTTPTSANLATAVTDETGTGSLVFSTGATLTNATLNSPIFSTTTFNNPTITGTVAGSATYNAPTLSGTVNISGLTASSAIATDGSKNLLSVTNTGTGNNVLATSPTVTTPNIVGTTSVGLASAGSVGEYISVFSPSSASAATVTMTIASPCVVTWTSHPYATIGTTSWTAPITFTTSGALPTGVTAGTTYWIIGSTATTNTFQIATTVANALAGTAINTSGSQSGTHTGAPGSPLTSGATSNVLAINLPAGDWDINAVGAFAPAATTSITQIVSSWGTVSAGLQPIPQLFVQTTPATVWGSGNQGMAPMISSRINVSSTTTIYLAVNSTFTVSTNNGFGTLNARRIR